MQHSSEIAILDVTVFLIHILQNENEINLGLKWLPGKCDTINQTLMFECSYFIEFFLQR